MIFEVVGSVLDDLDTAGTELLADDWPVELAAQMVSLEGSYRDLLNSSRTLIDYSSLAAQTAYVYRYTAGHAGFVSQILERAGR